MSKMWQTVLNTFNYIGDHSGCHQIPARCFCVKGYTFPMCARCTGALIGQAAAFVPLFFGEVISIPVAAVLLGIMGIDWGIQRIGWRDSTNLRRFITGILGGFGLFTIYFHVIIYIYTGLQMLFTYI